MSEPRYPTTADLMAFRGRLMSAPSIVAECPDSWAVRTWMTGTGWQSHPTAYAAWHDERRDGIGARDVGGPGAIHAGARREAAAMRSRAYQRHPCGSVAHVLPLSDIAPVTCQRRADHDGSHCARLPGAWQWWNRDDAPPPVEIPMAAYVNGGRPRDWIEPKPTR